MSRLISTACERIEARDLPFVPATGPLSTEEWPLADSPGAPDGSGSSWRLRPRYDRSEG